MVPMKRFNAGIRAVCEYAETNGFQEVRLNAAQPRERGWPHDDKKGVKNDHLVILTRGHLGPQTNKNSTVDTVAMVFNYVDVVTPTVKFTYRPAGADDNDTIEESVAYDLEDFRNLLNRFVNELPSIRGFGNISVQDAFIAAWVSHFKVGTQDMTEVEEDIENKLSQLYADYEIGAVDKQVEHKKADASLRRATDTSDKKLKESDLSKRRDELNAELKKVNHEISELLSKLKEIHSIAEKKQRTHDALRGLRDHMYEYQMKKAELLNRYPKSVARKFNKRFILNGS